MLYPPVNVFLRKSRRSLLKYFPYSLWSRFAIDRSCGVGRYAEFGPHEKFANIGAGTHFYHPRWSCFDCYGRSFESPKYGYTNLDLCRTKIPGKYRLIYSSHVVEHIPEDRLSFFLENIVESLVPGGCVRFVYPCARSAYEALQRDDLSYFEIYSSKVAINIPRVDKIVYLFLDLMISECRELTFNHDFRKHFERLRTRSSMVELLDYCKDYPLKLKTANLKGFDHVNWFTHEKLGTELQRYGLQPHISAFGQSRYSPMREVPLFDGWLPCISSYTEAIKA